MPNLKSAIKRVAVTERKTAFNKAKKSEIKTALKNAHLALDEGADNAQELVLKTQAMLDRAVNKNLIHKNKAARKVSQLVKKLK